MFKTTTISLFLALWLTSCCTTPPAKVEIREVLVDRPVALDAGLTYPPKFPNPPPFACRDPNSGQSTLCEEQVHEWLGRIAAVARQAIYQLEQIEQLQPKENSDD